MLDRPRMSGFSVLARLLRTARRYDAIVLDGSIGIRGGYVDQIAAGLIGRMRHGPAVVISDCTWKRGSWWLDRLACRAGISLADGPRVTYCVLSSDEVRIFPRTWGVDPRRVALTVWPYTLPDDRLSASPPDDGGVFAGGDSLRDYETLLLSAERIDAEVTIATRTPNVAGARPIPSNVRLGPLPLERYIDSMRRARIVVVPLVPTADRSAGQTTYVNAMAMAKPVIATDTLGIRDYIQDGVTGVLVPPGDADALTAAVRRAVDPANREEVRRMGERAREAALERFRPEDYVAGLVRIARERSGGSLPSP
jgi:glycosyltransferase involved in cell wall biosynthesis